MTRILRLTTPLMVALSLWAAGGWLTGCSSGESPEKTAGNTGQTGDQQPSAGGEQKKERKIKYWQAPMNPSEIYDHPGKSAMGMDLIPVYEDEASDAGGTVSIDPVTVQNMGVRTARVHRMDFTRTIRTVGKVDYNEEKLYTVTTKISGWIEKLYLNYTGEIIQKNQPLLEIYSPDLVTTQEEYLLALKTRRMVSGSNFESIKEGGESLLESTRKRLLYWDVPPGEIERLERTGEVKKTILLRSPASGMVIDRNAIEGAYVASGTKLYQIADLSQVWVHASIYDYELPWIKDGEPAEMELSYLPGKTFTGKVAYIYPYLREKSRDAHVRLEFTNPNLELKPGMYVNVRLQGNTIPDAVVVPSEAIIRSGERNVVFVVRAPGKFDPREIRLGVEGGPNNRYMEVLAGLQGGEEVVTSAQFLLDSESRLQEAIQKMLAEKKGAAPSEQDAGGSMDHNMNDGHKTDDGKMKMEHDSGDMQHDMQGMEHEQMDHEQMKMDHDMQGMQHEQMKMDHDMQGMQHEQMKMDHDMHDGHKTDEGKMNMEDSSGGMQHDMQGMEHEQMNHESRLPQKPHEQILLMINRECTRMYANSVFAFA